MPAKTALCPSCGAPVEFHSADSVLLVCAFCRSTLLRSAEKIENLGRMADLIEDFSPLQLGSEGRFSGVHFAVIGRIQLRYGAGLWNEWYLLFDDGRHGWLSDANGDYTVSFAEQIREPLGPFSAWQPGDLAPLNGIAFEVTNIEQAECVAGDGELPFKVGGGYPAPVVDARHGKFFATLDYSEDPPLVYIGESVERARLALTNLREKIPGAVTEKGLKSFECAACGAPIELKSNATERVGCTSCGSLLEVGDARLTLIEKARSRIQVTPVLPLGSQGQLAGVSYEVIGFMQRETTVDGQTYTWDEYLLFDARGEFRWLSRYDGHWNFIRVLNQPPTRTTAQTPSIKYEGETYRHFQSCDARVSYVIGEFNWRVSVGETAKTQDYVAPPKMLSLEKTANEITWSLGEYLTPTEIEQAFALKTPLATPVGVYANQPNPLGPRHQGTCLQFWRMASVAVLLQGAFLIFGLGGDVIKEHAVFGAEESSHTSASFELTKQATTLMVDNRADFDNGWLTLNLTLVDENTGQAWQANREISYYSGVDQGESWSEGSRSDEVVFPALPPGRYHLVVDGEAAPEIGRKISDELTIESGGARWSNLLLVLLFLASFPIWTRLRLQAFETRRWLESDHPPDDS